MSFASFDMFLCDLRFSLIVFSGLFSDVFMAHGVALLRVQRAGVGEQALALETELVQVLVLASEWVLEQLLCFFLVCCLFV